MVGKESSLKVWHSNWTSKGPLRNMIQGPLTWEANQLKIREFLVDTGLDWSKIPFELPLDIKQVIQATPISLTGRGKDVLAWSESPQGKFELKSAYKLAEGFDAESQFESKWIRKADTLPRIKSFLWQCAHNSIGVKACLARRGVVEEDNFPICQEEAKTVLHMLRDCSRVRLVWRKLGVKVGDRVFGRVIFRPGLIIMVVRTRWPPRSTCHGGLYFPLRYGSFGRVGITQCLGGRI